LAVLLAAVARLPRRRARRRRARRLPRRVLVIVPVEAEVLVVLLVFEFCAKTRLPKLRTKTRAITIPKFFLTDVSPFDEPLGRHLIMINELLNFERD
jgi:hypothetical protein